MKDYEKERILYRILSGKTILSKFGLDVLTPSLNLLYEAEEVYCEYIEKKKVLTQEEIRNFLVSNGEVSIKDIAFLKDSQKVIESLQKELCSNFYTINADSIRSLIKQARDKRDQVLIQLSKYEGYSLESVAGYAKSVFLISNTTYQGNKKYKFKKYSPIQIISELNNINISNTDIRELAKKSSWSNTWYTLKGYNIFDGVPSLEQQLLLMWSKIYDNIRESPSAPNEDLILDDDAIDGWLILQKEESIKKSAENTLKLNKSSKINNCQEVFIVAKTKEEADRIQNMNSKTALRIKEQRIKQIYEKGRVDHHNLIDVRMDVQEQFHKMQMEHIRGK
jgi:hypothetical protein